MGLKKESRFNSNKTMVSVKHYKMCIEADGPQDGFEEKQVNNPITGEEVTKYVQLFGSLEGKVVGLEWYDRNFEGNQFTGLNVHITDEQGAEFILEIPVSKKLTTFTKLIENIDVTQPVEFIAGKDKGSNATWFGAKQDGKYIRQRYTKDNLDDCPPAVQNKHTKKWDFSAQEDWLLTRLHEVIIPGVNKEVGADFEADAAEAAEARWA